MKFRAIIWKVNEGTIQVQFRTKEIVIKFLLLSEINIFSRIGYKNKRFNFEG